MNMPLIFTAALAYVAAAGQAWRGLGAAPASRAITALAIVLHGTALAGHVLHRGAVTIGVSEAMSLFAWQSALLLWLLCWKEPLQSLGLAIYPFAAIGAVLVGLWPTEVSEPAGWKLRLHILLSLFSAGLLTLGAAQAGALALQDRLLHTHRQTRLARALPPLLNMERALFQLIFIGFFLLSLTLLSGIWFVDNLQAQHLTHKTVLSVLAWVIFGVLLWGRWRHGWRGRAAVRWALSGYAMLILAYLGSKLILEQFLGRHWS